MDQVFLHELPDAKDLFEVIRREKGNVTDSQVEKDYWLMHCLWGLQLQGYDFELKGGTSLSKGFGIIERFSEDIDIQIYPNHELKTGPNHTKKSHIDARGEYFDCLAKELKISGLVFARDHA